MDVVRTLVHEAWLMGKYTRQQHITSMLKQRKKLFKQSLVEQFGCSPKTIYRDMQELNANGLLPNFYDERHKAYRLDTRHYIEIQGLWFTPEELHALLLIQQLTEKLELPQKVFSYGAHIYSVTQPFTLLG